MTRLDTICEMVDQNAIVHDIGCDHAYLLLKLYNNIQYGYALDVAKKPLNAAIKTINENNISDKVTTILSDGLEKVDPTIADTIVIAGMGAELIVEILSKYDFVKSAKYTFLLQPMTKSEFLRQYLYQNGFIITQERVSIEERRHYTIIKCKYSGTNKSVNIIDCYVSDALLKDNHHKEYINYKISKLKTICNNIKDKSNENFIYYDKVISKLKEYLID